MNKNNSINERQDEASSPSDKHFPSAKMDCLHRLVLACIFGFAGGVVGQIGIILLEKVFN